MMAFGDRLRRLETLQPGMRQPLGDQRAPLGPTFGPLRAHLSLGHHVEQSLARQPQVGQGKQRHELRAVLGQPAIVRLAVAKEVLDDVKGVLGLGTNASLDALELSEHRSHRALSFQRTALAKTHGHVPVDVFALDLFALVHTLVARIGKDVTLLTVEQLARLRDVADVGSSAHHRVHQTRVGIHPDVGLHAKVPLVALSGLEHLGVAAACAVLGRARCRNQGGVHHRALAQHEPVLEQHSVDHVEHLARQVVLLQQVSETQDGGFIGQRIFPDVEPRELAKHGRVIESLFHRRVREVELLLQKVDAQEHRHRIRGASAIGARRRHVRRNQRLKLTPRHHTLHLVKEPALARAFGLAFESSTGKAHLLHHGSIRGVSRLPAAILPEGRGFAECP